MKPRHTRPVLSLKGLLPVLLALPLLFFLAGSTYAQEGSGMYDAIDAGTFGACGGGSFTDYRNNAY